MVHRGVKAIALKECENVLIQDLKIYNATDLAVYFTACNNVVVRGLKLKVYIDGISPDNSKNVLIENCNVNSGDDGIVFKSSYNLNRIDYCENIIVRDCSIKSRRRKKCTQGIYQCRSSARFRREGGRRFPCLAS